MFIRAPMFAAKQQQANQITIHSECVNRKVKEEEESSPPTSSLIHIHLPYTAIKCYFHREYLAPKHGKED